MDGQRGVLLGLKLKQNDDDDDHKKPTKPVVNLLVVEKDKRIADLQKLLNEMKVKLNKFLKEKNERVQR